MLFIIEGTKFVSRAAIVIDPHTNHVIGFNPLFGFMRGWSLNKVQEYCDNRGLELKLYESDMEAIV